MVPLRSFARSLARTLAYPTDVTSDSGAVADIYLNDSHAYAASPPEGVALALNATCDVDSNLGTGDEDTGSPYTWYVQDAVDEGLLEYDENGGGISNPVDAAMNRTLFLRFALGLFDYYGPDDDQDAAKNPLWHVDPGSSPVTRTSSSPAKPRNSLSSCSATTRQQQQRR